MKKVLALGNSFSQNATTFLDKMVDGLFVRNLYIGGCSLEMHLDNLKNNAKAYDLQANGQKIGTEQVSANEIMKSEKWDVVTVQQVSGLSGEIASIYPHLTDVKRFIKEYCPQAEIVWHQTWAYGKNTINPDFKRYDYDQEKMYKAIISTSEKVCKIEGIKMIETGKAIQRLRENLPIVSEYNILDGFHLNEAGKFIAGLAWAKFFKLKYNGFVPSTMTPVQALRIAKVFK